MGNKRETYRTECCITTIARLNSKKLECIIVDLSVGGARVSIDKRDLQTQVGDTIVLDVKTHKKDLTLIGTVVKIMEIETCHRLHVSFDRISSEDETLLQGFINHLQLERLRIRRHSELKSSGR